MNAILIECSCLKMKEPFFLSSQSLNHFSHDNQKIMRYQSFVRFLSSLSIYTLTNLYGEYDQQEFCSLGSFSLFQPLVPMMAHFLND